MVTLNILTDLDVANGVRGMIEGIVFDECEGLTITKEDHSIQLLYPPQYVLVKLSQTKALSLEGLPQNVIPVEPVRKTFMINIDGVKMTELSATSTYACVCFHGLQITRANITACDRRHWPSPNSFLMSILHYREEQVIITFVFFMILMKHYCNDTLVTI